MQLAFVMLKKDVGLLYHGILYHGIFTSPLRVSNDDNFFAKLCKHDLRDIEIEMRVRRLAGMMI